ncbi:MULTISPECIES: XylR family transcriptional regulator [Vibrio]|uniref:XylR family transcriptional regulator n=1 Tax=Vibrio TaxID=662 RepID=UPI00182A4C5B|nr:MULTISPECIES: DNA-binding transcriptional regulator [Vibrio]MCF4176430.1 DNA-binding transcriptional regulator [Vibrio sp. McD22-P3]MCG9788494.1 DNA-binding transcriptional regulator [Vibrio mediterranei]MCY9871486.1 DNA-binding transcriptional regulator [Vibrio barjaei]NUW75278.1 DNA-binding transcriptional regulator [Vibrio mediterranei]USE03729.1 DNA-binding transcriptional regulator [Vibrio sp. SCSIO 43133]
MDKRFRITLLFNANKVYDRQVIEGVGEYLQASQCEWDIFLEEDFITHLEHFDEWEGDGIIADFDNPEIAERLASVDVPIVAVGGSYQDQTKYPDIPYIATDNYALVELAFQHLKDKGLENFAFYGIPSNSWKCWAKEREMAFTSIAQKAGYQGAVFHGAETSSKTWQYDMNRLADWLQMLPTPVGIIAVTDSRARHILQICEQLGLMVPDKVSVIGIDNEELARYLTRVSLSSVGQGCKEMGYRAAKLLHKMLDGEKSYSSNLARQLIPPTRVYERQSSDFKALKDPYVIQAMHYIRHNACKGIKVDQVLTYVGISRSNMENRFKLERGHSIHQELHNAKLNRACQLLISTSLPIAEISELCGYPSLQYMYSVFKKNLNQTPKDYRSDEVN